MIARRRINDITEQMAGGLPAAFSAAAPAPATPPVPVLRWRSCDGGFQCATARVPLSYRDPRGAAISIAVVRHLATDPARRAGTLFINSGGPAEQIDGLVNGGFEELPAAITARWDIILFDPRGFGYSTAVRCFPTMAAESQFLGDLSYGDPPVFPVGARQETAEIRTWARFDARCAQRNGSLLDHDTTADVARDMNLLREAVGAPALNYLGVSYGTGLGATYANLFPATTGRMVLDGNLNPVAWTHPDGVLSTFLRQGTGQAFAASMRAFLDLCGKATTSACAFSAGTPAATRAKWATLLRRLGRHPVTIGTPPQAYTYANAVVTVPLGAVSLRSASSAQTARTRATRPPTRSLRAGPTPDRAPSAWRRRGARRRARTGRPPRPRTVTQARGTGPRPPPSSSSATPATRTRPTRARSRCPGTWPTPGC
jgi:pimeloyl-ACP methyl ester carboxylesterase